MVKNRRGAIPLAAVTMGLGAVLAGQAQDLPFRVKRVTDRLTVFTPGQVAPPSATSVITTPAGLLLVDTGLSPRLAEMTRRRITRELGRDDVRWVINTHHHFDHTNGNQVYRGAEIVAQEKVPAAMRQFQAQVATFVAARANRIAQQENDLKALEAGSERARSIEESVTINRILIEDLQGRWVPTPPTRIFADALALRAGDLDLRLWHVGRAHTDTDIIVHVPSLGVVFLGDLFMANALGIMPEPGSVPAVARWVEVFDQVVRSPDAVQTVVGGHGDIMNSAWLRLQHRYMKDLWSAVSDAVAKGRTRAEVEPELDLKTRFAYVIETFGEQTARHRENIASYWRAATAGTGGGEGAGAAGPAGPPPSSVEQDGSPVTIGTYRVLRSAVMAEERPLLIHLPEGYERSTLRYPVLFHLYGQQVTNYFADAVMTAERLGGAAEIPPMIVVGVANTDRYRDNLPLQADGKGPGGADRFLKFFAEELIPFVDATYRTKPFRVLAGPQAGGACGLHALMTRPDLFHAYLLRIENPFPGAEPFRRFFLEEAAAFVRRPPTSHRFVRIVHGSDIDADTADFVTRLAEIIQGARLDGLRFEVQAEPPSGDFVPLVGLSTGLRALFSGYRMPATNSGEPLKAIENYYQALSARLGVVVEPPELVLTFAADSLIERGHLEAALELLAYENRVHADSPNALWRLGEVNRTLGRPDAARDYYRRFLAIRPNDAALIRKRLAEVEQAIKKQ